jgi:alcohol dehydrogenase YqhD (iron-dependent ADH family)
MAEKRILGILITDRQKEAGNVQRVLTKYGTSIKTRLGLHEVGDSNLSKEGLILLELTGVQKDMEQLQNELEQIEGTQTKNMVFTM